MIEVSSMIPAITSELSLVDIAALQAIVNNYRNRVQSRLGELDWFVVGSRLDCAQCATTAPDSFNECDSCGATYHHRGYSAHGGAGSEVIHFRICRACALFHSNYRTEVHE